MEKRLERIKMWNWIVTAAVAVVGVGLWIIFRAKFPPEVPMLYTRPWGQDQLVGNKFLLAIPALSTFLGVFLGLITKFFRREPILSVMTLGTSIVAQLVLIGAMTRIILLVL